jgi:NADH-quinone oxidoreductase subunit G
VTYQRLERAGAVLLAGFEPQDESPIVFLRLRKAARSRGLAVYSIAALAGPGLALMSGTLLPTVPGEEAEVLGRLAGGGGLDEAGAAAAEALRQPGSVILAGERLAEVPGALSAAARLAQETGAKLAWVPRRAGERGAVEAGALPTALPGGRPVADQAARAEVARAWGVASLPSEPGRDTTEILAATAAREIGALVIAGVDPADLPDPAAALEALEAARFVVSLELRVSAVTDRADVVLPVATVAEKAGTFVNWEGRPGSFDAPLPVPAARSDLQVLGALADEMDVHLGLPDANAARRELNTLVPDVTSSFPDIPSAIPTGGASATTAGPSGRPARASHTSRLQPGSGQAFLATWHNLLDAGRMQDGEPNLAGTARAAVAKMSAATAAEAGVGDGGKVTVATERGTITVPAEIADMPDRVVWLPTNSAGCAVRGSLGAGHGSLVTVRSAQ